jgi:hypothetical protein
MGLTDASDTHAPKHPQPRGPFTKNVFLKRLQALLWEQLLTVMLQPLRVRVLVALHGVFDVCAESVQCVHDLRFGEAPVGKASASLGGQGSVWWSEQIGAGAGGAAMLSTLQVFDSDLEDGGKCGTACTNTQTVTILWYWSIT